MYFPSPKGKLGPPGVFDDELLSSNAPSNIDGKAKFPNKSRIPGHQFTSIG